MIFIILPIYNEAATIKRTILSITQSLRNSSFHIIAVNDGSTDRTDRVLSQIASKQVTVIGSTLNMGVGAVFGQGIVRALSLAKPTDTIIVMEADGTSDVHLLPRVVYKSKKADIVIASRYVEGGRYIHFPLIRLLYSRVVNAMLARLFPVSGVTDYTIFYRAYRARVLMEASKFFGPHGLIQSKGFVANAELLIKVSLFAKNICETPFVYDYSKKQGISKIMPMRTINEYLVAIGYLKNILRAYHKRTEREDHEL